MSTQIFLNSGRNYDLAGIKIKYIFFLNLISYLKFLVTEAVPQGLNRYENSQQKRPKMLFRQISTIFS